MYIKQKDYELLLDVWDTVMLFDENELTKRYEDFMDRVVEDRYKASETGKKSMRKYRENNPEKAKAYNKEYQKKYRERNKKEEE